MSRAQPGDYNVAVTASDAVLVGAGASQKLTLAAKQRGDLTVPVTANAAGPGTVKVSVSGPSGFALQRSYTVTVRAPAQILARRNVQPLAKGQSVTLSSSMFADLVPGTGSVSISVGSSTALDAAALLAALDRYPYRCSEQITSRALPLLYVSDLASQAHVALDAATQEQIRSSIVMLLTRQDSSGSFGLWSPGGGDLWLDSYVTDFLTRAREHKFAVPDTAFKLALDRLRNAVADLSDPGKNGGTDIAYALYVLARNGLAPIGDLRYLADAKLDALTTPIAKAQIAAALALAGDRGRAERVYAAALAAFGPQPQPSLLDRADYGSTLRDAAAVLTLAAEGNASAATVREAEQRVDSARALLRPTSTQEDAWLLLAASAVAKDNGNVSLNVGGQVDRPSAVPDHQRRRSESAAAGHQYRQWRRESGRHRQRRAGHARARRRAGVQDRAADLHDGWRSGRCGSRQAEHPACRGAESHRGAAAVRPHHGRRLSAGGI